VVLASAEADQISLIETALMEKYNGQVDTTVIAESVTVVATALRDARIRTYVPVLIRRAAEDRVRQLVRS
jgi:hypothetical protein